MGTRTHIAVAVGIGAATLAFVVWVFMRFTPRVVPIPWRLMALVAVALIIVPIIAIPFSRWLHSPWNKTRAGAFFQSARGRVISGFCLAALFLALMYTIRGRGSPVAALAQNAPMAAMFAGFGLVGAGRTRDGNTPRCAKCEYDLSGAPEPADPADKCPECGALFRERRGIATGTKTTHPRLIVAGVLLIAVQFIYLALAMRSPRTVMAWYVPYLPTSSLIAEVSGAPRGFTMDEWAELSTRALTPPQQARLAEGLIDLRKRRGFLDPTAGPWLEKYAVSGGMPGAILERYYAEWVDLWLVAPESARAGERITVGVSAHCRGSTSSPTTGTGLDARVILAGISLGDAPVAEGRSSAAIHALAIQPREVYNLFARAGGRPQALGRESPTTTVLLETPGTAILRASVWVVVGPSDIDPVLWSEDGSPALPADTVWSRRVELERTVRVDP